MAVVGNEDIIGAVEGKDVVPATDIFGAIAIVGSVANEEELSILDEYVELSVSDENNIIELSGLDVYIKPDFLAFDRNITTTITITATAEIVSTTKLVAIINTIVRLSAAAAWLTGKKTE